MKRKIAAVGLAITLVFLAFYGNSQPVQAATCPATNPCVSIVGSDIVVVILGQQVARIPAPVKTVTVSVPTQIPGPVRTIIRPVPGPTRTVIVPGPTRTVVKPGPTVYVTAKPAPAPGQTGQNQSPSATLTSQPTSPDGSRIITEPGKVVVVTRTKAVGISLGLVVLGGILGFILSYLLGRVTARRKARQDEIDNLNELKNDLFKE